MAATTYVATTADGTTVTRSSATMAYTHVVLVAGPEGEGDYRWSQSAQAAQQCVTGLINKGRAARVVPVEQALTGKAAKAAIEAAKGEPSVTRVTDGPVAAPSELVVADKAEAATTTRRRATKAAAASTAAPEVTEERARLAALGEFEALITELTEAQERVARLLGRRNGMIDNLLTQQVVSGPKLAKVMGVTPMAVYNMRAKATKA